jgi:hypothetical protein
MFNCLQIAGYYIGGPDLDFFYLKTSVYIAVKVRF